MAIDRGVWLAVCVGLGGGALALALLGGDRPVPAASGSFDRETLWPSLCATAAAVDAACARGDAATFAAVTTPLHRRTLGERLASIDVPFDGAALRALAAQPLVPEPDVQPLAGLVRGRRAVVVVPAAAGEGAGARALAFEWDGAAWRFDGSHRESHVANAAAARALVVRMLGAGASR